MHFPHSYFTPYLTDWQWENEWTVIEENGLLLWMTVSKVPLTTPLVRLLLSSRSLGDVGRCSSLEGWIDRDGRNSWCWGVWCCWHRMWGCCWTTGWKVGIGSWDRSRVCNCNCICGWVAAAAATWSGSSCFIRMIDFAEICHIWERLKNLCVN